MKVQLIDGNNWVRVKLETAVGTPVVRDLFVEATVTPNLQVWVFDGQGGNKRRRDIYPAYKTHRAPSGEDIYASIDLLKKVLRHTKAMTCEVPGYEGDDVIASLAYRYRDAYPVEILSTDGDLLQLTDHPNVTSIRRPYSGVPAGRVRLYKTLVGDVSDNISGVPGLGDKTFAKINQAAIMEWLESDIVWTDLDLMMKTFGTPPKISQWMFECQDDVRNMWTITGFFIIPDITTHIKPGQPDAAAADALLKEYFL